MIIKSLIPIILLFLPALYIQTCSRGCLRCESSKCTLCDGLNHFIQQSGTCVHTPTENCKILSEKSGKCIKCLPDARMEGGACVSKSISELNSCSIFQGTSLCRRMDQGFPAYDFIFDATFVKIDHCLENETQSTCLRCEEHYILSQDQKSCLKKGALVDEDCLSFTNYECLNCQSGHFLSNNNYFLYMLKSQETTDEFLLKMEVMQTTGANLPLQTCIKAEDQSCLEFETLGECKVCKEGTFLDSSKICRVVPESSINGCLIYDSNLNCKECQDSYYRLNARNCVQVPSLEQIENCEQYDPKSNIITCLKCSDTHKYKSETVDGNIRNVCQTRSDAKDENCQTIHPQDEKCQECKKGFSLDTTEKKCYTSLENCNIENRNAASPLCSECIKGAFKNADNNCVLGSTENCETYTSEVCNKCIFPYILKDGACGEIQDKIALSHCTDLHATDLHQCLTCDTQFAELFTITDPCIPVTNPVPNCITYDSSDVCSECHEEYQLVSNECQLRPILEGNCLKKNVADTECEKCVDGYYVLSGVCLGIESFNYQNCLKTSGVGALTACEQCDESATFTIFDGRIGVCDFKSNSTHVPAVEIPKCEIYNADVSKSCKKCEENYVWSVPDTACVHKSTCTQGILLEELAVENTYYYINKINKCALQADIDNVAFKYKVDNCEFYVPKVTFKADTPNFIDDYVCSKCKKGYYPVFIPQTAFYGEAHINNHQTDSSDFSNRYYPVQKCIEESVVEATLVVINETLDNCELLLEDQASGSTYYACYKCKFGFTGRLRKKYKKYYISGCAPIPDCVSTQRYNGLGNLPSQLNIYNTAVPLDTKFPNYPFETWLTCHQCSSPSQIPFFGMPSAAQSNLEIGGENFNFILYDHIGFDVQLDPPQLKAVREELSQNHNFCFDQNSIKIYDQTNFFPRNCGAGMLFTDKTKQNYLDENTSMICIACKPAYKASMFSALDFAVESCTRIENCHSSSRFNGCQRCNTGYVLEWDATKKTPKYDSCVKSVSNCLYALNDESCITCKDGYVKHINGACYLIDLERTNSDFTNNIYQMDNTNHPFNMDYFVYNRRKGLPGSRQCNRGYRVVEVNFQGKKICMKNPNLFLKDGKQGDENSIDHCMLYKNTVDNSIKCEICGPGFVVDVSYQFCFENQRLINCKQATDYYNCSQCEAGFFLNPTTSNCNKGNIWGCAVYNSENNCQSCLDGYVKKTGDSQKCFLLPNIECEEINTNISGELGGNTFTCNKCKNHFFKKNTLSTYQICLPFRQKLQNCLVASAFSNGTRNECQECQPGYYLDMDEKFCRKQSTIDNCEIHSKEGDFCLQCTQGYFRKQSFKECMKNPTGVQFCEEYESTETCKQCKEYRYLVDNQCVVVPAENVIPNCQYYILEGDNPQCSRCENNFFLKEQSCVETEIRNCLEFESDIKCLKCKQNHSLQEKNGVLTCQQISKLNCKQVNSFNFCIKCDNGYYPDIFGNCKQVFNILAGCEEYLDAEKCYKCVNSKVLTQDRKFCVSLSEHAGFVDPKCESQQINKLMRCNRCKIGYYFDQAGKCTKCSTGEGCLYCHDQSPSKCLFCLSGYYMDNSGTCTFDQNLAVGEVVSASIIQVIAFWIFGLILVN